MAANNWIESLKKAEKLSIIQDGKRKVHYKFDTGEEMAEEYSMETNVLTKRAWRIKSKLGKDGEWEVEVGDPEAKIPNFEDLGFMENSSTPFVTKRITKTSLEWRIRNLPYPLAVYSVTAEPENKCITVRTTNKKYFKKVPMIDLERVGLLPEQQRIQFTHKHNTLVITYQKPQEVLALEQSIFLELMKLKTSSEGKMPCNPS